VLSGASPVVEASCGVSHHNSTVMVVVWFALSGAVSDRERFFEPWLPLPGFDLVVLNVVPF
jgi:hypothetical protein